jgi:hypothetical protein
MVKVHTHDSFKWNTLQSEYNHQACHNKEGKYYILVHTVYSQPSAFVWYEKMSSVRSWGGGGELCAYKE